MSERKKNSANRELEPQKSSAAQFITYIARRKTVWHRGGLNL